MIRIKILFIMRGMYKCGSRGLNGSLCYDCQNLSFIKTFDMKYVFVNGQKQVWVWTYGTY